MLVYLAPVLISAASVAAVVVSVSVGFVRARRRTPVDPSDPDSPEAAFVAAASGAPPPETLVERFEHAADSAGEFVGAVAETAAEVAGTLVRTAEEWANAITHGVGLVASVGAAVALVWAAVVKGSAAAVVASALFGTSMVLLYGASTAYHAAVEPRRKLRFRLLDHLAILYLIAGSYTPFALVAIGGRAGWLLFALIWGCALGATVFKVIPAYRAPNNLTWFYVGMGWLCVLFAGPMVRALWGPPLAWLVAGGLAYMAGVYYFLRDRGYDHAVWHLFVMGGTASHVAAVLSGPLGG